MTKNKQQTSKTQFFPLAGSGTGQKSLKKQKANDVKVRFIIKEAEYLMRCGRYTQVSRS